MTKRKRQDMKLEAALHGIKLKGTTHRPIRPTTNLDRQLAAGIAKGYRIKTGGRKQPPKRG